MSLILGDRIGALTSSCTLLPLHPVSSSASLPYSYMFRPAPPLLLIDIAGGLPGIGVYCNGTAGIKYQGALLSRVSCLYQCPCLYCAITSILERIVLFCALLNSSLISICTFSQVEMAVVRNRMLQLLEAEADTMGVEEGTYFASHTLTKTPAMLLNFTSRNSLLCCCC